MSFTSRITQAGKRPLLWLALLLMTGLLSGCALERRLPNITPPPLLPSPTSTLEAVTPEPGQPTAAPDAPDAPAQPTEQPPGRLISSEPSGVDIIWWDSNDNIRNHIGDSFLYAGYSENSALLSAVRFDLSRVPRGAPLLSADLELVGLRQDRLDPASGGSWSAQILAQTALPDFRAADYQAISTAPAAASLLPTLFPADLTAGGANTWQLDPSTLDWIEQQLLNGSTELWVRLTGPTGGGDTLFAWDSGFGPATRGSRPQLRIYIDQPPDTPPPLPTEPIIIGMQPATPQNVYTAAANALTATAVAAEGGTPTPVLRFLTATPVAQNIATAQAIASLYSLPPVVAGTPPAANNATATAEAGYATAVALATGTYTPTPENAVTPFIVIPTPMPENVSTAAVMMLTVAARNRAVGTLTPLPYNAVLATLTPTPVLVTATPRPLNAATASALSRYATAVAMTTGTFTPQPARAITPTFTPYPTAVPLIVYQDLSRPTATPVPDAAPREVTGKILFLSDRPSPVGLAGSNIWVYDPATGQLGFVTQSWVFNRAEAAEKRTNTGDGALSLSVEADADGKFQLFLINNKTNQRSQITEFADDSYDPAWRPGGNQFAFVSQEAGNDEIYVMNRDGSGMRRLTTNDWEWDKHPSYSPDGSQIVFTSNRGTGRRQTWIMDADGGNPRPLFTSSYEDYSPVWVK